MTLYTPRIHKALLIGTVCALFMVILILQQSINYSRVTEELVENIVILPGDFITGFIVGGFRGIAVDLLWLRLDEYWHQGMWFRVLPILRVITWLQPHFIEAWELGGWHLAYNMYVYAEGEPNREHYIEDGIAFLKQGLARNRNVYDLWFNIGWTYYHKLKSYDDGIRFFRGALRFEHPSYIDRLIAHAYRKSGDIESEAKEWKRCLTVFTDDEYHIDISKKHLKEAEQKLKKRGNPK